MQRLVLATALALALGLAGAAAAEPKESGATVKGVATTPDAPAMKVQQKQVDGRTGLDGKLQKAGEGPQVQFATNTLECGSGKTYEVSVKGGSCTHKVDANGNQTLECQGKGSNHAYASCKTGCGSSEGDGSSCKRTR